MRHPPSSSATAADSSSPHHAAAAAANYDADRTHAPHVIGGMKSLESLSSLQSLPVSSIADPASADEMLDVLADAQTAFLKATQADADKIAHAVARASDQRRIVFAALAVEETGMGILEDKALKNHFAAEYVWSKHAKTKTVGIIEEDHSRGITQVANPVGPIASIIPCTNPTSTIVFHILLAMKTRNTIVFLPHPRARRVSKFVCDVLGKAAVAAGAPPGCIACIDPSSVSFSQYIMQHEKIRFVLATGGASMVHAAYTSGKPTIAVGAGNCASIVDESANLDDAVGLIVLGKTFDNGIICASEQAAVVVDEVYDSFVSKLVARGVHFVRDAAQRERLAKTFHVDGKINPDIVGQSASKIAQMADITVPETCPTPLVLAVETGEIGPQEPFSYEKLCPILAVYRAQDFDDAIRKAKSLALNHGVGHTSCLHTNVERNRERIRQFELEMPTHHNLVNVPASLGAIGGPYNSNLEPSLTLGVGTTGGSSMSANLGPMQLLNVSTTAERQEHVEWFKSPHSVYFNRNSIRDALHDLVDDDPRDSFGPCGSDGADGKSSRKCRVLIITDAIMVGLGLIDTTVDALVGEMGMTVSVWAGVTPDPTMDCVRSGVEEMKRFEPDVVIALGGGSAIDGAKVMRLLYEHPEMTIEDMALRFIEIRRRIIRFPLHNTKVRRLICIPTTSGTGAEVTPFAVITSDDGVKYPLTSYALVPDIAIVDPSLAMSQPKRLAAYTGLDALTHALESLVSTYASDYTIPLSMQATRLVLMHLEESVVHGNETARAKVHHAATIAGLAFGNAFLGIAHSLAHQLGAAFHVPHGLACALVITHVMRYNAVKNPTRMGVFSQYMCPQSAERYASVARFVGLDACEVVRAGEGYDADDDAVNAFLVEALIDEVEALRERLGVPATLIAYFEEQQLAQKGTQVPITREAIAAKLDGLALAAFDDQCTGTNPRYPLISELKVLLECACFGDGIE
ncbi:aldehyde-alcohol dehydrogenase [Pycnococcus provasolii]